MALWLVRAGKHGEHEQRFFDTNRIYLTWEGGLQKISLTSARDSDEIKDLIRRAYPDMPTRLLGNNSGQIGAFALTMQPRDWAVVPRKRAPALAIGEITGRFAFDPKADEPYRHSRAVEWLNTEVPRTVVDQDLLYSFGSLLTICEISRNDAERRIRQLARTGWKSSITSGMSEPAERTERPSAQEDSVDLEQLARDQIAKLITTRFTGHGLTRLVEGILKAQGYVTYRSPEGPDKGIDILASPGPLGFGQPKICVQVKSGDGPVDSPTLNQLIGAMQNVHADQGLLVSWGGLKQSVTREIPVQFFRVRVWNQGDLITQILTHYEKMEEDLRAELPLNGYGQ